MPKAGEALREDELQHGDSQYDDWKDRETLICTKCGKAYPERNGTILGYWFYCSECVDEVMSE